jgi:hypothetical protein
MSRQLNIAATLRVRALLRGVVTGVALAAVTVPQIAMAAAPRISGTPATSVVVGQSYSFKPTASDADGNKLTFSVANKPGWASFSGSTGQLSGTPFAEHVRTWSNIVISVSDGRSKASLPAFSIVVKASSNKSPTITGTPPTTAAVGQAYAFTPTAKDPEGKALTFSVRNKPSWATFSSTTGKLSGTPTAAGTFSAIMIIASDGVSSAALPSFNITVSGSGGGTNAPPTITGTPPTTGTVGTAYTFTPTAKDPEGKAVTFSVSGKPSWASFSASTGTLSGTPTAAGTFSSIVISASDGTASASLSAFSISVSATTGNPPPTNPPASGSPVVLYSDLVAGPVSGGENNLGPYVSIFGRNFGTDKSNVHVYFGSSEVASVRYLGTSNGRSDIQQITVQPGISATGTLPIKVVVNGVASNTDKTYLVNPGDVLFVDNVNGNDSTAVRNDVNHPWKSVQTSSGGALNAAKAGDVIVLRGKAVYKDLGYSNRWIRFISQTGKQPTGAKGTGYLAITAYPNEKVQYQAPSGSNGGIHGVGEGYEQYADWIVISGLHISINASSTGDAAPINLQRASDNWRIVNNELGPWPTTSAATAGAISGNGSGNAIIGNNLHGIGGTTMNHCIYMEDGTRNTEVAFNDIHDCTGGNNIQTYDGTGGEPISGITIHHNLVHDGSRYGLNISNNSVGVKAWNNVIYNTAFAGIRLNVDSGSSLSHVYENNTLYNVCRTSNGENGAITNTATASSGSVLFRNNIVVKGSQSACSNGYSGESDSALKFSRNLFYGFSASSKDTQAVTSNPMLVSPTTGDFHLQSGSPAIDASVSSTATDDYEGKRRTGTPDLGALER